jgi:acetyl-CoA synthetase
MIKKVNNLAEYQAEYQNSVDNPVGFWEAKAEEFTWHKKWDEVLSGNLTDLNVKWFAGGKLNISENCLDRHLANKAEQIAIIWEPNDPNEEARKISYKDLHEQVCQFANLLKNNNIQKGDRVCIYMPAVPEGMVAMLACARIGAVHSVVFAGFSAKSLADRINDSECKMLITADGFSRGDKYIDLKQVADEALLATHSIETAIILQRSGKQVNMQTGRDKWWHKEVAQVEADCPPVSMGSEDVLFILYTSGSTGKPKGVVHTTAGYMVEAAHSFANVFQYEENDVYWCTADIGWVTGHSYMVYGPLLCGATVLMFEGIPTFPDAGRFWEVVDKYKVNIFYTAPTAIRALMAHGDDIPQKYDLSSLKTLGTVGEPINEEAWRWYDKFIGKGKCPIVDSWWQTETGSIMISPLAGLTKLKPSYATLPLPGVQLALLDSEGSEITEANVSGNLCIKQPWPSMIRTIYGDHQRCKETYFSQFKGNYFTGDGAMRDEDGYYRISGRVDDVLNVSGHRLDTAEIEDAIDMHPAVIEAAIVGYPHTIKGEGIYAFVIAPQSNGDEEILRKEILAVVTKQIGAIAKPDKIQFVHDLPKTRSGKIMRRILRKIAAGEMDDFGDVSTLLNPQIVDEIKEKRAS